MTKTSIYFPDFFSHFELHFAYFIPLCIAHSHDAPCLDSETSKVSQRTSASSNPVAPVAACSAVAAVATAAALF